MLLPFRACAFGAEDVAVVDYHRFVMALACALRCATHSPVMRFVFAIALAACTNPPPSSSSAPRSADVVDVGSAAPLAATTLPVDEPAPAKPAGGPLFTYVEAGDRVAFTPPRAVELTRADGTGCTGDLPDNGNMYSGKDVESAFADADVQKALASDQNYSAAQTASLTATGHPGTLTWASSCRGCLEEEPGVARLRGVLEVVVRNRKLVCP
jgi:hypothetical protein